MEVSGRLGITPASCRHAIPLCCNLFIKLVWPIAMSTFIILHKNLPPWNIVCTMIMYAYTLQESLSKDETRRSPTSGFSGRKQIKRRAVKLNSHQSSPHLAGLKPITTWFKHTTNAVMMPHNTCSECSGGGEHMKSGNCNCCYTHLEVDQQDSATVGVHLATRQSGCITSDGSSNQQTSILTGLCTT